MDYETEETNSEHHDENNFLKKQIYPEFMLKRLILNLIVGNGLITNQDRKIKCRTLICYDL